MVQSVATSPPDREGLPRQLIVRPDEPQHKWPDPQDDGVLYSVGWTSVVVEVGTTVVDEGEGAVDLAGGSAGLKVVPGLATKTCSGIGEAVEVKIWVMTISVGCQVVI